MVYACSMDEKKKWDSLIAWRHDRKWSQEALAYKLGVSVGTIHRWETGKRKASHLGLAELRRIGFKS